MLAKSLYTSLLHARIRDCRSRVHFLFLIGSIRSGSSVLSELLCNNKQICGDGEAHICYRAPECFEALAIRNMMIGRHLRIGDRYIFDKVLHNELIPDISALSRMNITWLTIYRYPIDTVSSIVRTFGLDTQLAVDHYVWRWRQICSQLEVLSDTSQSLFSVRYEDIVNQTPFVLAQISNALELREPLQSHYSIDPNKPRGARKDPSEILLTGKVITPDRTQPVHLTDAQQSDLERAGDSALKQLQKLTRSLGW